MCVKTASNKKFARTEFLDNTDPTIFPKKKNSIVDVRLVYKYAFGLIRSLQVVANVKFISLILAKYFLNLAQSRKLLQFLSSVKYIDLRD